MTMFTLLATAATKPSVLDKLKAIPSETWISIAIGILVIFVLVRIWKSLREVNEFVPWIVLITVGGAVVLYWTYERKEPKILTPIINELAKILPTRPAYKDVPGNK
jgi:di/tricarboxylate transporter